MQETMFMRIAIAGGGGFGYILAQEIAQTANAVLLLSTRVSTIPNTSAFCDSHHAVTFLTPPDR